MIQNEADARAWFRDELGCGRETLERLEALLAMLSEENHRQNLVAASSLAEAWVRHLADSAQLLRVSHETTLPWLDLGTGAGFPGLVIAIIAPERRLILVESRTRRADWLRRVIESLGVDAEVLGNRLETITEFEAGVISARAFAPLGRLLKLSARFSTAETQWLLPKGKNGANELQEMPKTIQEMFHVEPSLTDPESVILVGRGIPR